MDYRNLKGVASALPASWEGIRYLMVEYRTDGGARGSKQPSELSLIAQTQKRKLLPSGSYSVTVRGIRACEPTQNRWSPPFMDVCNPKGVIRALPECQKGIGYLLERRLGRRNSGLDSTGRSYSIIETIVFKISDISDKKSVESVNHRYTIKLFSEKIHIGIVKSVEATVYCKTLVLNTSEFIEYFILSVCESPLVHLVQCLSSQGTSFF
ncbi:hypothetical protein EVAR_102640_1 [Eumeta japonica]|uniref:Uncharacterized protein n=1 Tax=Eumeta variegata TaxID=151549 RepID=A0A4C1TUS7_EUMVA|nr:hypothetical protein EVAR_102640_1 [Eumeta japonica]